MVKSSAQPGACNLLWQLVQPIAATLCCSAGSAPHHRTNPWDVAQLRNQRGSVPWNSTNSTNSAVELQEVYGSTFVYGSIWKYCTFLNLFWVHFITVITVSSAWLHSIRKQLRRERQTMTLCGQASLYWSSPPVSAKSWEHRFFPPNAAHLTMAGKGVIPTVWEPLTNYSTDQPGSFPSLVNCLNKSQRVKKTWTSWVYKHL